jgi:hypothetical protein
MATSRYTVPSPSPKKDTPRTLDGLYPCTLRFVSISKMWTPCLEMSEQCLRGVGTYMTFHLHFVTTPHIPRALYMVQSSIEPRL